MLASGEQIGASSQDALFEEGLARFNQAVERLSEQAQRVNENNDSPVAACYLNKVSQSLKIRGQYKDIIIFSIACGVVYFCETFFTEDSIHALYARKENLLLHCLQL